MARKKVTENPFEDGDDAKFVKAHKKHRIKRGVGSNRTPKFAMAEKKVAKAKKRLRKKAE